MKVLMTTDAIGGVWTYSLELARSLQKCHVQILLVCLGSTLTDEQRAEVAAIGNIKLIVKPYKLEWMENPWPEVDKAGRFLWRLAQRYQPDVVHLNNLVYAHLPFNVPVINVVHSCVVSWWQAVHGTAPPSEWNEYHQRVLRSLQQADVVVAPSEAMLHAAEAHYGPFKNQRVIYNSSSLNAGCMLPKKPIIFAMGRLWDEAKNIQLLIKSAPQIQAQIYIAGNHQFDELGLPHNVNLLRKLPPHKVRKWLCAAALYVLPVKYEPFGLTFLEAALSGCAVVGGDIPSLREIWGDTLTYADTDDSDALAATCNRLLADDILRQQLVKKSTQQAQQYRSPKMAEQYWKLYQQLSAAPARPTPTLAIEEPYK